MAHFLSVRILVDMKSAFLYYVETIGENDFCKDKGTGGPVDEDRH